MAVYVLHLVAFHGRRNSHSFQSRPSLLQTSLIESRSSTHALAVAVFGEHAVIKPFYNIEFGQEPPVASAKLATGAAQYSDQRLT